MKKAKLFEYRPPKFFNDYVVAALNNTVYVVNKYQPMQGGAGPINPSNGNQINGLIRMGTADLFEDYKISGGFRIAPNLRDNDILFEFTNLRKRLDWGFTYYRKYIHRVSLTHWTCKTEFKLLPGTSALPDRQNKKCKDIGWASI